MAEMTLEERVTKLEKLVDELRYQADASGRKKDWRRTVGMFENDPIINTLAKLRKAAAGLQGMNTAQAGNLVVNLG